MSGAGLLTGRSISKSASVGPSSGSSIGAGTSPSVVPLSPTSSSFSLGPGNSPGAGKLGSYRDLPSEASVSSRAASVRGGGASASFNRGAQSVLGSPRLAASFTPRSDSASMSMLGSPMGRSVSPTRYQTSPRTAALDAHEKAVLEAEEAAAKIPQLPPLPPPPANALPVDVTIPVHVPANGVLEIVRKGLSIPTQQMTPDGRPAAPPGGGPKKYLRSLTLQIQPQDGYFDQDRFNGLLQVARARYLYPCEELYLGACNMQASSIKELGRALRSAGGCPRLRKLGLANNEHLGDEGGKAVAEALNNKVFPGLEGLWMHLTGLGTGGIRWLAHVLRHDCCPRLQELSLNNNPEIGDDGAKQIAELLRRNTIPHIRALHLGDTGMTEPGLRSLCEVIRTGHGLQLRELAVNSNNVGDDGMAVLAHVLMRGLMPGMEVLWLHDINLTPEGMTTLCRALKARAGPLLRKLSLHSNPALGDNGIVQLADVLDHHFCPDLETLLLGFTDCGPEGVTALVEALRNGGCPQLRKLTLHRNPRINDESASELAHCVRAGSCPNLEELRLSYEGAISASAQAELEAAIQLLSQLQEQHQTRLEKDLMDRRALEKQRKMFREELDAQLQESQARSQEQQRALVAEQNRSSQQQSAQITELMGQLIAMQSGVSASPDSLKLQNQISMLERENEELKERAAAARVEDGMNAIVPSATAQLTEQQQLNELLQHQNQQLQNQQQQLLQQQQVQLHQNQQLQYQNEQLMALLQQQAE